MAEVQALVKLGEALVLCLQHDVSWERIAIASDCRSAIQLLSASALKFEWHAWQRDWQRSAAALARSGITLCLEWVPSHGKRLDWDTVTDWITPNQCRRLNTAADIAAGVCRDRIARGLQPWLTEVKNANDWATSALSHAANVDLVYQQWLHSHAIASAIPAFLC